MPAKWLNLYHVTSYERAVKIMDSNGISPAFSQGAKHWCWYVVRSKVAWGIAHVMHRHKIELEQVAVLHVKVKGEDFFKTTRAGLYATRVIQRPLSMDSAEAWLAREETAVSVRGARSKNYRWHGYTRDFKAAFPDPNDLPD